METNYVNLVAAWQAGELNLAEAGARAAELTPAVRKQDPDGTVWYDGDFNNSALALEAFYPYDVVVEFLGELAKY